MAESRAKRKYSEAERVAQVRRLWQARESKQPTAIDGLIFYEWLEEHHPDLLNRGKGDPYQQLKVDLKGLLEPKFHL